LVNELCSKKDNCYKINMLKDKDLPDELFAAYAGEICRICQERSEQTGAPGLYEVKERLARFCHKKDFERGAGDVTLSFDECPPAVKKAYYEEADQILDIIEDLFILVGFY